jgi:hypothetical protein
MDKQDEFVEQIIANCNMLMIAAREATQVVDKLIMEWEVSEKDFVTSSR